MLTLLIGTDWVNCRDAILQRIADDVKHEKPGRILIVPELISHDTERRLCIAAGNTASRYAEVVSFSRLTKAVADEIGLACVDCLDNGGRVVAMAAAVRQLHSKLKAYAAVETKPEFLSGLVDAVDEFKRCCITAEDLKSASKKTTGVFAQKLEELGLILECYDAICQQGKRDPRDQMTWLLEQLESSSYAKNHTFYIDGFPDFTRQHTAIINHLVQESANVVVSMNCDCVDSNKLAFIKAGKTAGDLLRAAQKAGIETKVITINAGAHHLQNVREKLFHGRIEDSADNTLVLKYSDTIYHECLAAAEYAMELVRNGARYRDISIVYSDAPTYKNTLEMVFSRCHIPLYISGTESVLDKSVIATVLAALDAALNGFETEDVLRYMKSVLSPVNLDTCDKIENYIRLWSINGKDWLTEWTANPSGLRDAFTEAEKLALTELENARKLVIEPLVSLMNSFRSASNVAQQVRSLYSFLAAIQMDLRIEALARTLDESGDNRNAQILDQLWEILIGALEQMYDVLGATVWDTEAFSRLFKLLLCQYDVGTIPPVLDAATAGPVSAMRCQQVKHLLVLGAAEGCLPGYSGAAGILSDQERTALRAMGVPLTGGALEGLQSEFAEIYGVFCGARSSVYVSHSAGEASFVYRRLLSMAGNETHYTPTLGSALGDASEAGAYLARTNSESIARSIGILAQYEQYKKHINYEPGAVSIENITGLYGTKLNLSASQVDKLADCRCHYFLRYGLRVDEQRPVSVDPAEFGSYVHAVLENTARDVCALGGFDKVSEGQTLSIAREHSRAYAEKRFHQISAQRSNYLFKRNSLELELIVRELWAELHSIPFVPIGFEVSFGDECELPAIDCSGTELQAQLRGFVDRVDRWKDEKHDYFRVVDYKTGKKDFDYCDVFNGLGLQMLLYLFALEQNGQDFFSGMSLPAGVQYFPARVPFVSVNGSLSDEEAALARSKNWKRKGLLLLDDDVLSAMDSTDIPDRLPYTVRKDGTYTGDIASKNQFNMLKNYIFLLLRKMVDEIASGNITPNPYTRGANHNACTFCPYGEICHMTNLEHRRNYQAMSAQRFWEDVEKEVSKNG